MLGRAGRVAVGIRHSSAPVADSHGVTQSLDPGGPLDEAVKGLLVKLKKFQLRAREQVPPIALTKES